MACSNCERLESRVAALESAYPAQSPEALQRLARALAPALALELARIERENAKGLGLVANVANPRTGR